MGQLIGHQHKDLAMGRWTEMPFAEQMGNIGSEVSRSLRWSKRNIARFQSSFERALELMDLSIEVAQKQEQAGKLVELCRAREEFCDYFYGENSWKTDPKQMQKYYDQFAMLARA